MKLITDIFSTRELALLIWLFIALAVINFRKNTRESLSRIFKLLFGKQIGTILLLFILYIILTVFLLWKISIWDLSLMKDTLFWFISVALVLFLSINKVRDTHFFKETVKESFKWTIIVEFLVNFYTFSLPVELILLPIMLFLVLTQAYSKTERKYEKASKFLTKFIGIIVLVFIGFATYKTFCNSQGFFTLHNLLAFLLPSILTILLIPLLYMFALYINYEEMFIRIDFLTNDNNKKKSLKREILLLANVRLNRLTKISKNIKKFDIYHSENLKSYLRTLIYES